MNKLTNLRIHTESLPIRCEVCHQTDCFNPDQNWCSRCKGLSSKVQLSPKEFFIKITFQTVKEVILGLMKLGFMTGGIMFLLLGFIWFTLAEPSDAFLVLAVLALATGLLGALIFATVFLLGIITLNTIENLKWRFAGKQHPIKQV
ncbi:MAG: hypothetical protein HY819_16765 [Acidobacteria bacterium]|nr:hypothetical protein [Acidobacteriota bacterium]